MRFRTSVGVAIVVLLAMGVFLAACGSTGSNGNPGTATAPQITTQPADKTVMAGQTATFSVTATGTAPLTYQWQRGTQNVGTNSSTYTTPVTQASDNGAKFQVMVTNSAGSVTSSQATLTVNSGGGAPVITQQPASQTVTAGQPANFTVAATGATPLSYQWTKNGASVGTNSSTYNIASTALTDNNAMIQVRVSNASGNMLSNTATLTVKPPPPPGNANVLTFHNDNGRTGQNLGETALTPTTVNSTTFGKLATLAVDGLVDGEPLYVSNLSIGGAPHNVVFVVTEHDSVYAFDADTFVQLWKVTVLGSGESTSDNRGCGQVTPEIGITSTPVIDTKAGAHGTMYLVAMSKNGSNYFQRLHALDISTGAEESGSPVLIQGSFTRPVVGGLTTFDPKQYKARPGLLLMNAVIYVAWASHCDANAYQGWVMGYSQSNLQQASIINVTPNGSEGAIWMSGYGLAGDSTGNIYFLDANGTFDDTLDINSNPNMADYGNGFLKLSTAANTLAVADYFNMHNTDAESNADEDLGSGGAMVLPDVKDNVGNTWHLAVGSGKDAAIYVVNRDLMGKFNVTSDSAIYQLLGGATGGGVRGGPAYFNNTVYFSGVSDTLKAFPISNAKLATSPSSHTASSFGYPGSIPSISANGNTNGIVWTVENASGGLLHAYDATNLAKELYNSNQAANGRDHFSNNKFITPMIANGKVFVGTPNSVVVFGFLP